jgi:hypothetical protein
VTDVAGRRPVDLDAFIGVTSFTVTSGNLAHRVFGTGEPHGALVRFRQQDLSRDGRIIRTWAISTTGGSVIAQPDPRADSGPAL